eukprot:6189019-Pleurochrysis_carterae.AAC.6
MKWEADAESSGEYSFTRTICMLVPTSPRAFQLSGKEYLYVKPQDACGSFRQRQQVLSLFQKSKEREAEHENQHSAGAACLERWQYC